MNTPPICGLDVGISTTDAVAGWSESVSISLPTGDPTGSAERAISRLLEIAPPDDREVLIAATGVGAHRLPERVCGFAVRRVPEVAAIGRGGVGVSRRKEGLVVSLGTGTAMVSVRNGEMSHVSPGSGVGGGTLLGLARSLLGVDDLVTLADLARRGNHTRLDLTIGEVVGGPLGWLPESATASNFGKTVKDASREDLAAALANLVAEVVLATALLGLQASGQSVAILVGKLLLFEPIGRRAAEASSALGGLLVIPENGAVAIALGALWSLREEGGNS
jgi:type II pantothenate kinase